MTNRLKINYDILSDFNLKFVQSLKLPTFSIKNRVFIKRLTIIVHNYKIDDIRSRGREYCHSHFYLYNIHQHLPTNPVKLAVEFITSVSVPLDALIVKSTSSKVSNITSAFDVAVTLIPFSKTPADA